MVDRSMEREAFVRMSRCWLLPGAFSDLDSRVSLSHGQEVGPSVDNSDRTLLCPYGIGIPFRIYLVGPSGLESVSCGFE